MKHAKRAAMIVLIAIFTLALTLMVACTNSVKLSFVTNGGTECESVTAEPGSTVDLPAPEKEGFLFAGWYASEDLTGTAAKGSITAPEKSTTYYAKWDPAATLTLDLDGGTLSSGQTVQVAVGANVADAVKDLSPVKGELAFGCWYDGDAPLSESKTMPEGGLTLTAKYTVAYSVNLYGEKLDAEGEYVLTDTLNYSGLSGVEVTVSAPELEGFVKTESADEVSKLTLTDRAAENLFKFYYTREIYTVNFYPGDDAFTGSETAQFKHGETYSAPEQFWSADDRIFAGWSKTRGGEVDYHTGDPLAEESGSLYAVWDLAYTDVFGGSDYLFLPRESEGKVILDRAGARFEGTIEGRVFRVMIGTVEITGIVNDDGQFSFYHMGTEMAKGRQFYSYVSVYNPEEDTIEMIVDKSTVLTMTDGYDGASITVTDEEGNETVHNGKYFIDFESGNFRFVCDDDDGLDICFLLGSSVATGEPCFAIIGGEAGDYTDIAVSNVAGGSFYFSYTGVVFSFNGIDTATMMSAEGEYPFTYAVEGVLEGPAGPSYLVAVFNGAEMYHFFLYADEGICLSRNDTYGIYTGTIDGAEATLDVDGFGVFEDSIFLTVGEESTSAMYYSYPSIVENSYVIAADFEGGYRYFLLNENGTFVSWDDRTEMGVLMHTEEGDAIGTPILVMEQREVNGIAGSRYTEVYYGDEEGNIYPAAIGYCTAKALGSNTYYTFTRTALRDNVKEDDVFETASFYSLYYYGYSTYCFWYACEIDGVKLYDGYNSETDGELRIFASEEFYTHGLYDTITAEGYWYDGEEAWFGTFTSQNYYYNADDYYGYITELGSDKYYFAFEGYALDGASSSVTAYFRYDREAKTFVKLVQEPYVFDFMDYQDFLVDGEGGFTCLITDYETYETTPITGSYKQTGTTIFGDTIYTATFDDDEMESFEFVFCLERMPLGATWLVEYAICPKESEPMVYAGAEGEIRMDGFAFRAQFTDDTGSSLMGFYGHHYNEALMDYEESVYVFTAGARVQYFASFAFTYDVYEDGTFAARDGLEGDWTAVTDSGDPFEDQELIFTLDGHGNVSASYGGEFLAEGIYYSDGYLTVIELNTEEGKVVYETCLYQAGYGDLYCCIKREENAGVFVSDDGRVLNLLGNKLAYYSTAYGMMTVSLYTLYGEDAVIATAYDEMGQEVEKLFLLDRGAKTYSDAVCGEEYAAVYMASDLAPFIIGDTFVVIEPGNPWLYSVDGDEMKVFTSDGMETIPLPKGDSFEYGGKTYYRYDGGAITFRGTGEYEGKEMTFTPQIEAYYNAMFYTADLTFADHTYDGVYYISVNYSSWSGSMSYTIECYEDYDVWEPIELVWDPNGTSTFSIPEAVG